MKFRGGGSLCYLIYSLQLAWDYDVPFSRQVIIILSYMPQQEK